MCCKSSIVVTVTICYLYIYKCYSYNLRCPDLSQRSFRGTARNCTSTKNSNYQRLYDESKFTVKEFCKGEEIAREGFKYILEPNPQQVDCSPPRYQPFTFTSHELSYCIYKKSGCNEEGQVVTNNGSTTSDRQCRCDYTKGYMFVHPPKRSCVCIPTEEDCSCYYNPCFDASSIMLPDYRCVNKDDLPLPEMIMCSQIVHRTVPLYSENKVTVLSEKVVIERKFRHITKWTIFGFINTVSLTRKIFLLLHSCLFVDGKYYVKPVVEYADVTSKLETNLATYKDNNSRFQVVEGDSVTLHCNATSFFQLKSFRWVKYGNGTPDEVSTTQVLTIENVTIDNSGKYACIITNSLGLSNAFFNGFINDLPLFHTEEDYVSIEVFSLKDKQYNYTVYLGNDVTFKSANTTNNDMKKLVRVEDCGSLSLIEKRNTNGNEWTKTTCCESDKGKYLCLVYDLKGRVIEDLSFQVKLHVIEKDSTYKHVLEHRKDTKYVQTSVCQKVTKSLEKCKLVLIKGRTGSGKSKLCLEVASEYEKKGFCPLKIETPVDEIQLDDNNMLYYIDDIDSHNLTILITRLNENKSTSPSITTNILATFKQTELEMYQNNSQDIETMDLDTSFEVEDKIRIIQSHMADHGINPESFKIFDEHIITLLKTDLRCGFPMSVSLFCNNWAFVTYLYKTAKDEHKLHQMYQLCVLVYMFLQERKHLMLQEFDKALDLFKAIQTHLESLPNVKSEILENLIENAAHSLVGDFLMCDDNVLVFSFISPSTSKTVLFGAPDFVTEILIKQGSLNDILEFITVELFAIIEDRGKLMYGLCKRLVMEFCHSPDVCEAIGEYLYVWISERNVLFRSQLYRCINNLRIRNPERGSNVQTQPFSSFMRIGSCIRRHVGRILCPSNTISLIKKITNDGRNTWIYEGDVPAFVLLCSILLAVKDDYFSTKTETFEFLRTLLKNELSNEYFKVALCGDFDQEGNFLKHLGRCRNTNSESFREVVKTFKPYKACYEKIFEG